ncbi:MAG: hypothetical protein HQK77_08065 [Desulfobacterales bacterium]|nr:hypothetical protein [Desulfobacterales bacterium]
MKQHHHPCDLCTVRGYSPELCRIHTKSFSDCKKEKEKSEQSLSAASLKEVGKSAIVGAGVGTMAAVCGLALVPAAALKALFGHVMTVKVTATAGVGMTGAGFNVIRHNQKKQPKSKKQTQKKYKSYVL